MTTADSEQPLRRFMLILVLFGAAGLLVELVLLEHYDSIWQWSPLALLVFVLGAGGAVWLRPGPRTIEVFRAAMIVSLVTGLAGLVLHLKGNMEWALERDPELHGLALVWKMLRGATPALAPGALAQLGLLGLLYTYRHPALRRGNHPEQEII